MPYISWIDWAVIAAYLGVITLVGVWTVRRVTSSASYFISDRKFGKVMMMFFTFGTGTHSDQAVSVAAKTYRVGASGIWYQWLWLFSTPFFWVLAPMFRRMRAVTTGDYFAARYNQGVAGLYALVGVFQLAVNIGVMLKGSSAMISAVTGGLDPGWAIAAMTVLFVIYGVAGGLAAAIVTDFIQGLLTLVLSFLLLPFALDAVGGLDGLRATLHDPAMFKIVAPDEITGFYIAVIAFNALVGVVTQPHFMGMCGAGRTEMEARVGVMGGILFKRVCTIAWVIAGLCAAGMYLGQDIDVDHVYGLMARDLLPQIAPGLIGLFIASMLAAVMSSCDAFMVASAALFTENLYKPLWRPGRSDRHYMRAGRVTSALVVLFGILVAFNLESVVSGLELFWKIAAMMAIPFWVGLFWRRATPAAAWASTAAAFAVLLFTSRLSFGGVTLWDFDAHFAAALPGFMIFDGALSLPWQILLYLGAGLVVMVLVSLVSRPAPEARIDAFYACLATPVTPDEPETQPFVAPPGAQVHRENLWLHRGALMLPRFRAVDAWGFLAGCAAVALLIAIFYWILQS